MRFSITTFIVALAGTTLAMPAELVARVDCSSASCQALIREASCIADAAPNPIEIVLCLADAGGVSNVCPCIACLPGDIGDILSSPGIC